jgi:hypothetical protein
MYSVATLNNNTDIFTTVLTSSLTKEIANIHIEISVLTKAYRDFGEELG